MSLLMDALRRAEQAKEQTRTEQHDGAAAVGAAASAVSAPAARLVAGTTDVAASRATPAKETSAELALSIDEVAPVPRGPAADPGGRPALPRDTVIPVAMPDPTVAGRLIAARARQSRRRRLIYVAGGGGALLIAVLAFIYFEVAVSTARLHEPQAVSLSPGQDAVPRAPGDEGQTPPQSSAAPGMNTTSGQETITATPRAEMGRTESVASPRLARHRPPAVAETDLTRDASADHAPPFSPVIIAHTQTDDPLLTLLAQAFDAYQAGHDEQAEATYRQALALDANNRDTLLGMAAVMQRGGRIEEARLYYQHLLEINPLDSAPVAGLVGLRGASDPVSDESRIKLLLKQDPAAHLYFALGTLYVAQSRWADAQQAFFDAYSRDPASADAAFNLAVCLDRLTQPASALGYYRRSLDLARGQAVSFKEAQVEQRIAALADAVEGAKRVERATE